MMDKKLRDSLMETLGGIIDVMGATITADQEKHGVEEAIRRFEERVVAHDAENGNWLEAPDDQRAAAMLWAASELIVGAMVNAGVWLDMRD